jgi:uncharacterized protein YaaN involved in tellurite resistance
MTMSASPLPSNSGLAVVTAEQYALSTRQPPSLPPLAEAERVRARQLALALVPGDERLGDIVQYGGEVQSALADITRGMLAGVRVKALDEILQLSDGVLAQVRQLNLDQLSPMAGRTLLWFRESAAAVRQRVARFFKSFELVSQQLDRQEADIFRKEAAAAERYHASAQLERATRDIMLEARLGVAAIEVFLEGEHGWAELQRRQRALDAEKAAAARHNRSVDFAALSAVERYAKYLERVEMKRTSLQQAVLSAYQAEVTIRMLQDNENIIRQKLSDIRTDLLPQWRTRVTIAYNAYLQQGIAVFVRGLERAEAELRLQTADQIERTAASVADLMTRQVFDPVAMKYHQDKLIGALETLKAASLEARRIRDAAEATTKRSLDELGQAVAIVSLAASPSRGDAGLSDR